MSPAGCGVSARRSRSCHALHGGCNQDPGCTRASRLDAAPSLYELRVDWCMNVVQKSGGHWPPISTTLNP